MIVALHADAGAGIGLGHVSRCTGLALALRRHGIMPVMLNAAGTPLTAHYSAHALAELRCDTTIASLCQALHRVGAKALVADSYRLDRLALRDACADVKLVWFDDTASQPLAADVVVNGSPAAVTLPYDLPAGCFGLLGAAYQVVRPGILAHDRLGEVRRLLVTYGGADPKGVGPRLAALLPDHVAIDFIVGPFADIPSNLPPNVTLHKAPTDLLGLIDRADLALCAGGQTLFEMAAAKLPSIAIGIGEDQRPNLETLSRQGAVLFAGWVDSEDFPVTLAQALRTALTDATLRQSLARQAHELVDGKGADRIATTIANLLA
ncbi:MAG: hypothetical protein LDL39_03510 [Magnetospirillum sp.]|nr:hypothetical protein [Magnetospirillum sp.]